MDVERTIEFILQHQAHFAAEMEQLKERHKEFSAEMHQLKERHVELHNSVEALTVVVRNQQEQITPLLSVTEVLARNQAALVESQRHTDERLNALIKVVDDLVRRDGQHG
jgi:FtsZ-binding cell division protein ZapB